MRDGGKRNHHLSQLPSDNYSYPLSTLQCQALGVAEWQSTYLTYAGSWAPSPALKKGKKIEAKFCEVKHYPVSDHPLLDVRPLVHK